MAIVIVTGADSGLGKIIAQQMEDFTHHIVIRAYHSIPDNANGRSVAINLADMEDIKNAAFDIKTHIFEIQKQEQEAKRVQRHLFDFGNPPDFNTEVVLVNCAGVNEINLLEDLTPDMFDHIMAVNAKGPAFLVKELLDALRGGTVLNVVSNASNIPMTASLAYNASKAAFAMITKQMARELFPRHNITVFGLSPNKMHSTGMTEYIDRRVCETRGWSMEEARNYQLQGLPIKEETDPQDVAQFICYLLDVQRNHKYLHGCILPYGGPM